jgi:hypothetical protein
MKSIGIVIFAVLAVLLSGCAHSERPGDRWVSVLDAKTKDPVEGVQLVYQYVKKPYWIVGQVVESPPYVSNAEGKAFVPSGEWLSVSHESDWLLDWELTYGAGGSPHTEIFYVRKRNPEPGTVGNEGHHGVD